MLYIIKTLTIISGGKKLSLPQFMKKDEGIIISRFDMCCQLYIFYQLLISDGNTGFGTAARKISMPQFMKKDDGT